MWPCSFKTHIHVSVKNYFFYWSESFPLLIGNLLFTGLKNLFSYPETRLVFWWMKSPPVYLTYKMRYSWSEMSHRELLFRHFYQNMGLIDTCIIKNDKLLWIKNWIQTKINFSVFPLISCILLYLNAYNYRYYNYEKMKLNLSNKLELSYELLCCLLI